MLNFTAPIDVDPLRDEPSGPARRQIIMAAEKLFARQGLQGTSLREIAVAANHGNNNAVRYHFGSKEGLTQAIFRYRAAQMDPLRQTMLQRAEQADRLSDMRTILSVICLPHLALRDDEGHFAYAAFLVQYLLHERPRGMLHAMDDAQHFPALRRAGALFYQRLAFLPFDAAERRLMIVSLSFLSTLVSQETRRPPRSERDFAAVIEDTLDMLVMLACTPHHARDNLFPL